MKTCFKCGAEKSLSDFYRHKAMADGHLNKCKICTKVDSLKYRSDNLVSVREYDRERRRGLGTEPRIKVYRDKNPNKYKAHTKVNNAVRDGRLAKPNSCEVCGCIGRVVAHHNSYDEDQWLVVEWLCQPCHTQKHKDLEFAGIYL